MIARKHRFHGYGSLRSVYQHGATVRGPVCALKYLANPRRDTYRLAVVVSKKVSKSAVVRNRIRRRLYEIIRQHAQDISQPYDMVLTVFNESVATMESVPLQTAILGQLKQAGILAAAQPKKGA